MEKSVIESMEGKVIADKSIADKSIADKSIADKSIADKSIAGEHRRTACEGAGAGHAHPTHATKVSSAKVPPAHPDSAKVASTKATSAKVPPTKATSAKATSVPPTEATASSMPTTPATPATARRRTQRRARQDNRRGGQCNQHLTHHDRSLPLL